MNVFHEFIFDGSDFLKNGSKKKTPYFDEKYGER